MVVEFLKWTQLVGRQFWKNDQKLQENYKINIFGLKQWEAWGEEQISPVVEGVQLVSRTPLGETLGSRSRFP